MNKNFRYVAVLSATLISTGCATSTESIRPFYTEHNPVSSLLEVPIETLSNKDIQRMKVAKWSFEVELKKNGDVTQLNSCETLLEANSAGYKAMSYREYSSYKAQILSCKVIADIGKLKPSHVSHIDAALLTDRLPDNAPPELALIISKDDERRLAKAESWQEISHIKKIEQLDEYQVIYYDNSGGIQKLALVAKGDYNQDGIEDVILYMENSVEGGSYSTDDAFIITRLSAQAPYTLLKQL